MIGSPCGTDAADPRHPPGKTPPGIAFPPPGDFADETLSTFPARVAGCRGIRRMRLPTRAAEGKKKIVFIAGNPSHGYGAHEHNAGCDLLARLLKQAMPELQIEVVHNGWPKDEKILDGASTIVMYCDGGGGHMVLAHKKEVDALAKHGIGIVCLHYAVEVPKENGGPEFLDWIGGYFEMNYSVNPHWTARFDKFPDHPIDPRRQAVRDQRRMVLSHAVSPRHAGRDADSHARCRRQDTLSRPTARIAAIRTCAATCWKRTCRSTWPGRRKMSAADAASASPVGTIIGTGAIRISASWCSTPSSGRPESKCPRAASAKSRSRSTI